MLRLCRSFVSIVLALVVSMLSWLLPAVALSRHPLSIHVGWIWVVHPSVNFRKTCADALDERV